MAEYIEREKDKYIKLSQALEVLDSCACWWAHERMERIHAADVRPVVRGEWTLFGRRGIYGVMYECSACHAKYDGITNFCPNCGADMRGLTKEV